jgi:hypothetical protein
METREGPTPIFRWRLKMCLSIQFINSRGWRDLVEHDNLAMRAPILQAIKELARISKTSTELRDEYEIY